MTRVKNTEIDPIECEIGHKLPALYRKLLVEEGCGTFGNSEIYDPRCISEIYSHHFEDQNDLFIRYFPFGCNNETQEIWLILVHEEKAASIWHETHPDDYADEEWLDYEFWSLKHLK